LSDGIEDKLPVDTPLLKRLFKVLEQALGFGRILPPLCHLLEEDDLLGHTVLTLGDVPVSLGHVLALLLQVRHGFTSMRLIQRAGHEFTISAFMEQVTH
jgi:hypothetical protein